MADGDYPHVVVYDNENNKDLKYFDVLDSLNNQNDRIKELESMIDAIRMKCEPFTIPLTLTTFIPTEDNCKRYHSCHENHTTNAQSYGQSRMANKVLKVIKSDNNDRKS